MSIILFKDKRPNSCFLDQIYDPDVDGKDYIESETNYSKIVPQEGATVVDRSNNNKGVLYFVMSVDKVTLKSTLLPTRTVVEAGDDAQIIRIISYGNDRFILYFVDSTKPTKLIIDSGLVLYGNSLVEYQLVKTKADGTKENISIYLDSDEVYKGTRIPLTSIGSLVGAKQCTNCHTLSDIVEGDTVELQVFDNLGILSATIALHTMRGTVLNDLASSDDIITKMTASSLQMLGDEFYIKQYQDPEHLGIIPTLHYSDGTKEDIAIDNKTCFLYGLENFSASFPGQKQNLLIKKYLGNKEHSPIATTVNGTTFVTCEKTLTVVANSSIDSIKISVLPIYNPTTLMYTFKYIAYTDRRNTIKDVTNLVTLSTPIDGGAFNSIQHGTMVIDLQNIFGTKVSITHTQHTWIKLKPYAEYQRYLISDNQELDPVYGAESAYMRRPTIHYDTTLKQYFVPTSKFGNKEAFVDAFYYASNPPYNPLSETKAPTPTHFTLRDINTLNTILAGPIPITEYNQAFTIITQLGENPDTYVGRNLIVEFLVENASAYEIVYGVPVDVFKSTTGWNSEMNDIR